MFGWLTGRRRNQSQEYLNRGRLEDVIALIQVLGLDRAISRGERALQEVLRGAPNSAKSWTDLSKQHAEFFRVYDGTRGHSISLIARYLTGNGEDGPALSSEYITGLIDAAVHIHQGQIQRRQVLRVAWAAIAFAALPAIINGSFALVAKYYHW